MPSDGDTLASSCVGKFTLRELRCQAVSDVLHTALLTRARKPDFVPIQAISGIKTSGTHRHER